MNHVVVKGETLGTISAKYLGSSTRWKEVWKENPQIVDPNKITPGQVLRIPSAQGPVVAPVTTSGSQLSVSTVQSSTGIADRIKGLLQNRNVLIILGIGLTGAAYMAAQKRRSFV